MILCSIEKLEVVISKIVNKRGSKGEVIKGGWFLVTTPMKIS